MAGGPRYRQRGGRAEERASRGPEHPREKGAQRRGGVAAPGSARAERELGEGWLGGRDGVAGIGVGWPAGRGACSPEGEERKPGRLGCWETNSGRAVARRAGSGA